MELHAPIHRLLFKTDYVREDNKFLASKETEGCIGRRVKHESLVLSNDLIRVEINIVKETIPLFALTFRAFALGQSE